MRLLRLVTDEVVSVRAHHFRIRVWRGTDSPPVVLLSQVHGDLPPDCFSSKLATLVLRNFLGSPAEIPAFFELSRFDNQTRAFRVRFETIGCHLRPFLIHPTYVPINPQVFKQVFGIALDTPDQ